MHWVIQDDFHEESLVMPWAVRPSQQGYLELLRVLEQAGIPHSLHKVVPLVGDLEPDIDPPNPVIVIGSYSMRHVAAKKGWTPGCFASSNFDFEVCLANWGDELLNSDATVYRFDAVPFHEEFFMRPCEDSKAFAGDVFGWDQYVDWVHRVVDLGENVGSTLKADTRVLVCEPKQILREYRLWVVDGRVVTASQYRVGGRVLYDTNVDDLTKEYGEWLAYRWQPDRAFVLDVGLVEGQSVLPRHKVIEVNCLNAAGFYYANIGKLVEALENMGY